MRIAFISHYPQLYGANHSLLGLINGLKKYDVTSHVLIPSEGDMSSALYSNNIPYEIIPFHYWSSMRNVGGNKTKSIKCKVKSYLTWRKGTFGRLYKNIKVIPQIVRQMKIWNVDLVYSNSSVTPIGALVARKIKRPHLWHLREFGDLDYELILDWGKHISRYFIGHADARIAVSKAIGSYYSKNKECDNLHIIYNGIATLAKFDKLHEEAILNNKKLTDKSYTFAIVGQVHPSKGQQEAIKALSLLKEKYANIRLLVVGGGNINSMKEYAESLGISDNVEFWGYISDTYKAYFSADAVLMCSRHEAMGRVTVEAMSACRPVIGYDNAGTSELIQHGHTGLLYKGEVNNLAECMKQFIKNPQWASNLGYNGWYIARQKYNIEYYAKSVYDVLLSLIPKMSVHK